MGKTYTALGVAKSLGAKPLVICPKSVKSMWRRTAESFGVPLTDVCNIEQLKAGGTPYLMKLGRKKFSWRLAKDTLIIFDECHKASGYKSENSKVLAMTKAFNYPTLLLSATVADSPLKLRAVGYLLGLHKYQDHYTWCLRNGCYQNRWNGLDFLVGAARLPYLKAIHDQLFPAHGVRVRIQDLGDVFPDNLILAEAYDLAAKHTKEIERIYDELDEELRDPSKNTNPLTALLRARQQVELFKVPLITEMINEYLEEGKSVVVFVSFKETLKRIAPGLPLGVSLIVGGQPEAKRDDEIHRFQSNKTQVCLCMIQAGGVGLSLHDLTGDRPRVAILTPTYTAVELKQALGRIHRAGGKSKCIQKIVFAAGTVEEKACAAVKRKLTNISLLNDGDLTEGVWHG